MNLKKTLIDKYMKFRELSLGEITTIHQDQARKTPGTNKEVAKLKKKRNKIQLKFKKTK